MKRDVESVVVNGRPDAALRAGRVVAYTVARPRCARPRRSITNERRASASIENSIANDGERVTHLYPNDLFYAHLSLYHFVLPMARDAVVLDAGCGSGYGSAYLADNGARSVRAFDVDDDAVRFCRQHFDRPNLTFDRMDVQRIEAVAPVSVDLAFSSNTMEHVPDVLSALRGIAAALRPGGVFVLAVPPVVDEAARRHELLNPHHLHVWSPAQWRHTLLEFFEQVDAYSHRLAVEGVAPDFRNAPGDSSLTQADFAFERSEDCSDIGPTLTALFVARAPRAPSRWPSRGAAVFYVDDSVSRRPPGGPSVSPAVAFVEPRPLGQMPGRALRLLRERGPRGLGAEVRQYARWLRLRRQARRLLRTADHGGNRGS